MPCAAATRTEASRPRRRICLDTQQRAPVHKLLVVDRSVAVHVKSTTCLSACPGLCKHPAQHCQHPPPPCLVADDSVAAHTRHVKDTFTYACIPHRITNNPTCSQTPRSQFPPLPSKPARSAATMHSHDALTCSQTPRSRPPRCRPHPPSQTAAAAGRAAPAAVAGRSAGRATGGRSTESAIGWDVARSVKGCLHLG